MQEEPADTDGCNFLFLAQRSLFLSGQARSCDVQLKKKKKGELLIKQIQTSTHQTEKLPLLAVLKRSNNKTTEKHTQSQVHNSLGVCVCVGWGAEND